MRRVLLGGFLMFVTFVPAYGQSGNGRFIVGNPVQINNQPIDLSKAIRPTTSQAMNLGVSPQSAFRNFSFGNFMPKISLGSFPGPIPQVSMLPQKQNQFQPVQPKGLNLFEKAKKDPKKSTSGALKIQ